MNFVMWFQFYLALCVHYAVRLDGIILTLLNNSGTFCVKSVKEMSVTVKRPWAVHLKGWR